METTYIIDATNREVIMPKSLAEDQVIKKVGDQEVIITTEVETERVFGGAFVKLRSLREPKVWVSSSLKKGEEFLRIVSKEFKIPESDLVRYF